MARVTLLYYTAAGGVAEDSPCVSELSVNSESANSSPALAQVVSK